MKKLLAAVVSLGLAIVTQPGVVVAAGGTTWTTSTIEGGGNGYHASITLDTQGRPRVSYSAQDGSFGIRYAALNAGSWTFEQVVGSGHRPSIALTAQDEPRIAYRLDSFPPETRYAKKVGMSWSSEFVSGFAAETWGPSLALMANGDPGVAFRGGGGGLLNYAHRPAGFSWMIESPTFFDGNMNNSVSLAMNSLGLPQIAFTDGFDMEYVEKSGSVWTSSIITNTGEDCSLALDDLDNPHISFHDDDTGDLMYATRAGGAWAIETVDTVGTATAIALAAGGSPSIAYIGSGQLRFAYRLGGTWTIEVVDAAAQGFPSIDVDAQGRPHIAFLSNGVLRYAIRESPLTDVPPPPPSGVSLRVAPNPIGVDGALVSFTVPADAGDADLSVFDVTGRRVRTLATTLAVPGPIRWDGADDTGRSVSAGLYLFKLRTATGVETQRVTLVR
jgi:flagellar hook capping protein FlgD